MKRIAIGVLIFVIYLGLVIAASFALHFAGARAVLFCVVLGLLGALAIGFSLWYLRRLNGAALPEGDAHGPDAVNLRTLLHEANARLRGAARGIGRKENSLASMPLLYVVGDENSAKTQTVLQSGLDPELLAGAVLRDQAVAPTQLVNLWLAGDCLLLEAGGAMLRNRGLWNQLIKSTLPSRLGSAFSKDSRMPARSVLVCVSIERIMAPNTAEQIRALAQSLNERLHQLSQSMGIALPVYVLFTKVDNIGPFAEYARQLTEEEVKLPVGAVLPPAGANAGLYTEQATASISTHLDQLFYALAEFRLDLLSRGGELQDLARAYEFPRDLRKLRAGMVSFLVELARPSQIAVSPFLRGFFLTGMRAHFVEDVAEVGPAQAQAAEPSYAGATRIFSIAGAQSAPAAAPVRRGGTRKVPQWVFLPHLFSHILLADTSALETSRASARTQVLRRGLLAAAAAAILAFFALATISFFNNRALEQRVASAASTPVAAPAAGAAPSLRDLQTLDGLRAVMNELDTYRNNGAPLLDRMGLYRGAALYPIACQTYAEKFRTVLLAPTEANLIARLNALPSSPSPDANYGSTYRPLKAYLMVGMNPNPDTAQDTVEFLPAALLEQWPAAASAGASMAALVRTQFEFFARQLAAPSSCMAGAGGAVNTGLVGSTRAYLNQFQGFQHVYQSMLAAANRKVTGFDFNSRYPGSAAYVVDTYTIHGAFTRDGFAFMQDAILHPDQYLGGEAWVLGPSSSGPVDRTALSAQLKSAFTADYVQAWRTYLNRAQFVGYRSFPDAASKLGALDSNTSALLELFSLASTNTSVAWPEISSAFQAPQAIVPAAASPDSRLIASSNQGYIQALQGLEGAVKNLTLNPASANDPTAAAPIAQAATAADQAAETLRNGFVPDPAGGVDKISFNLLEAPILSAKSLAAQAPAAAAGGAAQNFCSQLAPLLSRFPFDPRSTQDATPQEVAQVFAPGQGALAQFYNTSLKALIVQQGSDYVVAPGSAVKINPAFLNFLGRAQRIGSTLFPSGGNQPSLDFRLTEVRSPGAADAALSIDGNNQIRALGQSAAFHWISQPGSRITLATQKNTAPPFTGPWSVFHFAYTAPQVSPNRMKFSFSFNNQAPEIVLFDASGPGAFLLNPEFMRGFRCVSSVAR